MDSSKVQDSFQAEHELALIRKIMQDSRNAVSDNGWHYIYWGTIVTVLLVVNYFMAINRVSGNTQGFMWFVTMISASIIEGIIEKQREKKVRVKTFAGKLLNSLWAASGFCMFMLGFAGTITGAYSPLFIFPLISTVLGLAYFVSGAIQQIKWLRYISVCWWAGAALMFYYAGIHSMLVFAGMLVCFQVIPGVLLYLRSKKQPELQAA
ncbi:MAG: hypothetical protein JNK43_12130 [Ignavibacteria bacterium]|nr:hypothetical protein [Ignavibacteria bacterium]